jgi:N-acetyl-alpha-D-muramate 1-phosphate uridylyltransferase
VLPVLVLCGGRGTRLAAITNDTTAKVMVPVAGRPFIDYKLEGLASDGAHDVVLSTGFGSAQIRDHVGDGGQFGLRVRYVDDGAKLLGTGGAVNAARRLLPTAFWVTYGDTLLEVDTGEAERRNRAEQGTCLMTVLRNSGQWGASNATVLDGRVVAYGKDPAPAGADYIDYGMILFTQDAFADRRDPEASFDLADVLSPLAARGELLAFTVDRRFFEIGTPEALAETAAFLSTPDR